MGSQSILNQMNAVQTQIDAVDPEEIKKEKREKNAASMQADIDVSNSGYDSQISNTQAYYDKQIGDAKIAYEDAYQKNAVQKLINEKQIAERNANLGLTDSGLNRTQQTAAQISYANQKGKIDIARQNALDELNLNLTDAITTLENQKSSAAREITNNWNAYSDEQAQNEYNTKITGLVNQYNSLGENYVDMVKAENEAEENKSLQKIYWFRGKSDNEGKYLYYNTETGKNEEVPEYMNPYTSNDNRLTYSAEYNDENIGFFNLADGTPGYQPRGLVSEGGKFLRVEIDEKKPLQFDLYGNGKYNTIWYSPSGHYWIWDDLSNSYKNMDSQVIAYFEQT